MRTVRFAPIVFAFCALCGCSSGAKFAPVSGRVTLNGNPLTNAVVEFQPIAESSRDDPGPGSVGFTDADGKFTLHSQLDKSRTGAIVGKHRVRISPAGQLTPGDADASDPRKPRRPAGSIIPIRYNLETTLEFEVPSAGTSTATFELTAP